MAYRGLNVFIADLRNVQHDKDKERRRIDKECANIRAKFTSGKNLDSYNRKKYVWKMIYMHMLGYEVDFGHMEMIKCLSASKYSEKHVGYVGISLLLKNTDDMMTLVINTIRQDLTSAPLHGSSVVCGPPHCGRDARGFAWARDAPFRAPLTQMQFT